ncbi:MAG: hypothetical protein ACK5JS_01615 [Mangrovibacterium sp.]
MKAHLPMWANEQGKYSKKYEAMESICKPVGGIKNRVQKKLCIQSSEIYTKNLKTFVLLYKKVSLCAENGVSYFRKFMLSAKGRWYHFKTNSKNGVLHIVWRALAW